MTGVAFLFAMNFLTGRFIPGPKYCTGSAWMSSRRWCRKVTRRHRVSAQHRFGTLCNNNNNNHTSL